MRICFVSNGYPFKGLPYSAFIAVLCEELTRQGCEVTVVAPQSYTKHFFRGVPLAPRKMLIPIEVYGGKRNIIVYRPYSFTFGDGIMGKLSLIANRLATKHCVKFNQINPDVVYAHFWTAGYNILPFIKKNKLPFFVATGEDVINIQKCISKWEIADFCKNVTGTICVSTKNQEESISLGLTTREKTIVIPNAVNPKDFYLKDKIACRKRLGYDINDFIIAFCGRFVYRKGVMRVSDAISLLNNKNIKSIFIGSKVDNEKEVPNCSGILFMGQLSHKQMVDYLNCADVFVLPTLAEGCSNSIIEAMACGLPIISSDLPFNYDILDSSNSILVNPRDVHEIAKAIQELMDNPNKRKVLSQGAIKKASEFTIEKRAKKIKEFIVKRS